MANRNNTGRTRKSHNFRPYDSQNSFVQRITAKVSEILPQPTSWVSRLFSKSPKLNIREREELEEEEEDEEERQPPTKRLCFSSTESNDYTHQNNINRLGDLDRDSGEISPIVSSRVAVTATDEPVPGPSGLHLRHFPISSTPAIRTTPVISSVISLRGKGDEDQERRGGTTQQQQQRDDASDESESTSGCSSLVPGTHPRQEPPNTPSNSNLQSSHPTSSTLAGSLRRLSSSTLQKSSNTSMNRTSLNRSSSSQPAFDTYVFNNPLNRSGIMRKRLLGDESCFYSGNTTFGGSSARSPIPIHESPRVVTVKASPTRQSHQQDTIGASALKILRALEQFSTPVVDAKKMPIRRAGGSAERGKRKPPQPYEELIFPSMTDLLRVKRREREIRAAERSNEKAASSSSTAAMFPSTSSTVQPGYSLRNTLKEDTLKGKNSGSIMDHRKSGFNLNGLDVAPEINLPTDVRLELSTLPKLNLEESEKAKKAGNQSKSASSSSKGPLFKFSEPLEALQVFKKAESTQPPSLEKPLPPEHQMKNPTPNFRLKRKSPQIVFPPFPTETFSFLGEPKPDVDVQEPEVKADSVPSVLFVGPPKAISAAPSFPVISKAATKINDSKPAPSWECLKCALKNVSSDEKCKSCGLKKGEKPPTNVSKGFEGFSKPKGTWECKECFVNNKNSEDVCAACATPRNGIQAVNKLNFESNKVPEVKVNDVGVTSTSSLPNTKSIKIPTTAGSWECDTCLVKNKKDDLKCVACSTVKPGAKLPEEPKSLFSFGIPPTSSSSQSTSSTLADTKPAPPQFTFGIPTDTTISKSNSSFSFGDQKKTSESVTSSVTTKVSSTLDSTFPVVNSFKKSEGSWECGTCLVVNKKDVISCVACSTTKPGCVVSEKPKETFSFGIPPPSSTAPTLNTGASTNTSSSSTSSQPVFTFGVPSANPSLEKDVPKSTTTFMANSSNTTKEIKPFNLVNSVPVKENALDRPISDLFSLGNNSSKSNKTNEINDDHDDKPPSKKRVSFGDPLTSEKSISNDKYPVVPFSRDGFSSEPPVSASQSSNFTFTPFENREVKTVVPAPTNSFFTFGGSSDTSKPQNQSMAKPLAFGGVSSKSPAVPNTNSAFGGSGTLDGFKMPETENKPFSFMANSQSATPGSFGFNNISQGGDFGSQAKPNSLPFGQAQPQPPAPGQLFTQPQEPKPFVFNAPPTQQMNFGVPSTPAQPATSVPSGGFNFVVPDPTAKPSFNFTGGATPTFNAAPNKVVESRKIKRGVRRVSAAHNR